MKNYPPTQKELELESFNDFLYNNYNLKIKKTQENSPKTKLLYCEKDKCYIIKELDANSERIYEYLYNLGVENVIYPELNSENKFITKKKDKYIYLSNYYKSTNNINEKRIIDLFDELKVLHSKTSYPKELSPEKYRKKFDEISKRLDFKFKFIEEYIRSLENRKIDSQVYRILDKYHIILNAKKELIRLQKRLILNIKDHETIDYVFIHNNPKSEHLVYVRGNRYLTSIEQGKMGVSSLDYAKFYIENSNTNLDIKTIICNELLKYESDFYYDYFRFLVLFIYINRINISNEIYQTALSFDINSSALSKFLNEFVDRKISN